MFTQLTCVCIITHAEWGPDGIATRALFVGRELHEKWLTLTETLTLTYTLTESWLSLTV